MKKMMVALKAGCSCESVTLGHLAIQLCGFWRGNLSLRAAGDDGCAMHNEAVTPADMTHDIARVLFAQFPSLVQHYVDAIASHFQSTWELPRLMQTVGITSDAVLQLRGIRVACVLEMLDFAAQGSVCFANNAACLRCLCNFHVWFSFRCFRCFPRTVVIN